MDPIEIAAQLSKAVHELTFAPPVTHVYNPLAYAWDAHRAYLERYGRGPREILLLGMNPGPFGMAQTGVPFGDVRIVRDWLHIACPVCKPEREHPKRPILGFDCPRSEVSGSRLWGWARARYETPDRFFARFFVHNYCPLCFMEAGGKNLTPDKLPPDERAPLFACCDRALQQLVACLRPRHVIGVGAFAEQRLRAALPDFPGHIGRIPHPSPASPAANRDWAAAAEAAFTEQAIGL